MKYLMTTTLAITLVLGSFTFAQANETPVDEYGCPVGDGFAETNCRMQEQLKRERESQHNETRPPRYRNFGEVTDVDPLAETAQGGDRDGDVGGGDFGGENDRAAASTAAE